MPQRFEDDHFVEVLQGTKKLSVYDIRKTLADLAASIAKKYEYYQKLGKPRVRTLKNLKAIVQAAEREEHHKELNERIAELRNEVKAHKDEVKDLRRELASYRLDHSKCSVSTGIDESITAGQGRLDFNGFWEFPCHVCEARNANRERSRLEGELDKSNIALNNLQKFLHECLSRLGPDGYFPDLGAPLTERMRKLARSPREGG